MKIAILSMQRVTNFGSVLQAYSLRQMIEDVTGERVEFIDIEEDYICPSKKSITSDSDCTEPEVLSRDIFSRAKRWTNTRLSSWNKRKIYKFMTDTLQLTENNCNAYDVVVVGSDEVLNHRGGVNLQLHGAVKRAGRVITYAASCGSAIIEDIAVEDRTRVREALGNFSAVSVRDEVTKEYLQQMYDGDIHHHLDPVLVGNLGRMEHRRVPIKNYLLVYAYGHRIRNPKEIEFIQQYAKEKGLKTVAIGGSQTWCDMYIPVSPFRAMDYFYHADAVVTDTFHGSIFSVIHHKKFAVIMRRSNRGKLSSLLKDLELEERIVPEMEMLKGVLDREIQYDAVDETIEKERMRTCEYLRENLKG